MSHSPTLVFIPGAWHRPTCYDKVIQLLEKQHRFKCISITLPSTTGRPTATFKDDIDAAREAISQETNHGRNVVVLAHSYGGMVGNSAIRGFTQPPGTISSQKPQTTGHVIGLILIASGFTLTGLSFLDPVFGHALPFFRINKETGYAELVVSARELFYHDVPAEEAEFWVSQLTTHSVKSLSEGGEHAYAGWKDLPTWYIGTIEDHGLPVVAQRIQVGMAREMGGSVEHRELQTSHSPFLSQPEETVDIILEAIRAFTGESGENQSSTSGRSGAVAVPKTAVWQPSTWIKYGLPLTFGHVIGRCLLLFSAVRRLLRR